ncbi:MAG TPA: S-methyl-5'-thioadenosine phosphorylase [Tepidiformaceae bacterium]|nr:S-methyl-5'-thioadenosine phosphorylase [Tepidiformaceae bacterium]
MAERVELAVIGGSGFYEMPGLREIEEIQVATPFGNPSDAIRVGTVEGRRVAFLARHGRGHRLLPSEIPQLANVWALKSIGVRRVIGVSAVGSLREELRPREFVVPDQLIDRTSGSRASTFFGSGVVAHVAMADPFCPDLSRRVARGARTAGAAAHEGGALVVIEGPAFGTRAESETYRRWGGAVVGMTAIPEAKLLREAEICYGVLTAVTDYDSWKVGDSEVDAATVFAILRENVEVSREAIRRVVAELPSVMDECGCERALESALVTPEEEMPAEMRRKLEPILRRRIGVEGK